MLMYEAYPGAYSDQPADPPPEAVRLTVSEVGPDDDKLRLSDVGKLARRTRRRIVGAARADDRPTFAKLISEHLRVPLEGLEVVEESWPSYELVNVQLGLNAWLAGEQRTHQL